MNLRRIATVNDLKELGAGSLENAFTGTNYSALERYQSGPNLVEEEPRGIKVSWPTQ